MAFNIEVSSKYFDRRLLVLNLWDKSTDVIPETVVDSVIEVSKKRLKHIFKKDKKTTIGNLFIQLSPSKEIEVLWMVKKIYNS